MTIKFSMNITADDVSSVEYALSSLGDTIMSVDIDAEAGTVTVTTSASAEEVEEALRTTGKDVRLAD
ncbi:MAG: heavy-metal-associated domain-containing protein [Nannocystis sp.]|nr:heavy-metal-associated domain-containing protein [Nannocystis sp.]